MNEKFVDNTEILDIPSEYEDYREELQQINSLGIADQGTSIISTLKIEESEGKCISQVIAIKNSEATSLETTSRHQIIREKELPFNEESFVDEFLVPVIKDFTSDNLIEDLDNVLITSPESTSININANNRNSLSITGLNETFAQSIMNKVKEEKVKKEEKATQLVKVPTKNENGIGDTAIMIAIVFLIAIIIVGIIAIAVIK